jgi:hypothetical protein
MADKKLAESQSTEKVAELSAPEKAVLAQAKIKTKTTNKHIEAAREKRLAAAKKAKG